MAKPDWQAEGLTEGLYGRAKEQRVDLLDELHEMGFSLEELRAAVSEDRLPLLPVERVLGGEMRYTEEEVSEKAGVPIDDLRQVRDALGVVSPDTDERVYTEQDLNAARMHRMFLEAGIPADAVVELSRVLGLSMSRYAEAVRTVVANAFLDPGIGEYELAQRYADVADNLGALNTPLMEYAFTVHLRELVRRDVISYAERESGIVHDSQEVTVCFADIVGFTSLSEEVPTEELGIVATRLSGLVTEALEPPARLIKTIGDAVMLVSTESPPLVRTALRLVELAEDDPSLPSLRAGLARGSAVGRWGDWYGTAVNTASRVTTRAKPGSVLVTDPVRRDAEELDVSWSKAGSHRLKGISSKQRLWRVRPDGEADGRF